MWEFYNCKTSVGPAIEIRNGKVIFNEPAVRLIPPGVQFLRIGIEREKQMLGFFPAENNTAGFELKNFGRGAKKRMVVVKKALKAFGLPLSAETIPIRFEKDLNALVIEIEQLGTPS